MMLKSQVSSQLTEYPRRTAGRSDVTADKNCVFSLENYEGKASSGKFGESGLCSKWLFVSFIICPGGGSPFVSSYLYSNGSHKHGLLLKLVRRI